MKQVRKVGVLLVAAAVVMMASVSIRAEEAAAPRALRIGVVKIQDVFKEYKFAKEQEEKIKASFKGEEDSIAQLEKEIVGAQDKLSRDTLIERNSAAWKLQALEIQKKQITLDEKKQRFAKMTRQAMAEFYRSIYKDFRKVVDLYAKEYNFDLVITAPETDLSDDSERSDSPLAIQNEILLRRVQYISPSVDITKQIVASMNNMYAAKGAGR